MTLTVVAGVGVAPMQRPIEVEAAHDADATPGPDTPKLKPKLLVLQALMRCPEVVGAVPVMEVDTRRLPMMLR